MRCIILDFLQGISQIIRIAANFTAIMVGLILTRTADGHLNQHSGNRCQNNHCQSGNRVAAILVIRVAKEGQKLCRVGDNRCHHSRNRSRQDIAILNMGELMGQDARELIVVQHIHDSRSNSHGCMVRIAARGKSIWHIAVDDANLRHGEVGISGQFLHQLEKLRSIFPGDFLRTGRF